MALLLGHHRRRFALLLVSLIVVFVRTAESVQTPIEPGSSLTASNLNQTWTSPNSTFFLGFLPSPSAAGRFSAAVFYSGNVPVWYASSSGDPVLVDSRGTLHFDSSGALLLRDGSGTAVWNSGTSGRGATSLFLNDTGNLILRNALSSPVWTSFDHPADAVVPGMSFAVGAVLRSGRYSFRLESSGNLTLTWNDTIVYWNQGLNSSYARNLTSPSLGLQGIGILSISDRSIGSPAIFAYSNDYAEGSDVLRFLRLDGDGNLRIYSSALGSGDVTERWTAVTDQCEVFGYCGNMGVCSYNESSPVCGCPSRNFEPVDPRDRRMGCRRKVEIADCPGSATMLDLAHTRFLTFQPEYDQQVFFVGISACRLNCLVSGSCDASTSLSDGTGLCFYKTPGFLSAYRSPAMTSSSYIKVCGQASPNPEGSGGGAGGGRVPGWVVAVSVVAALAALAAAEGAMWWWFCRNRASFGGLSAQYALLEYASGAPVQFTFKELSRATRGFGERLGAGGFGAVYRGVLANKTPAAVKRLEGIEQGEKQFRMEVATISSTHHLNLVRLIGFCSEGRHRLLVYEFMKNGSLDAFLFSSDDSSLLLSWEARFGIALGTARGITYLHEECRDCIVHCDIKPENILLDEAFHAKVSDFGLAKLINPKDHRYRTLKSVRGTRGYLAPEWLANLPITSKSDIYSYGMVLLEIVSGRRNFNVSSETNHKKFSMWAYDEFDRGNVAEILDPRLMDQGADMDQVARAVQVSFWCIQEQPSHRPTMGKVVQMLEGIMEIERPPAPRSASEAGGSSIGGTSIHVSSNASALSTLAPSAPAASEASSFQTVGQSPTVAAASSGRASEKASSSLLN